MTSDFLVRTASCRQIRSTEGLACNEVADPQKAAAVTADIQANPGKVVSVRLSLQGPAVGPRRFRS